MRKKEFEHHAPNSPGTDSGSDTEVNRIKTDLRGGGDGGSDNSGLCDDSANFSSILENDSKIKNNEKLKATEKRGKNLKNGSSDGSGKLSPRQQAIGEGESEIKNNVKRQATEKRGKGLKNVPKARDDVEKVENGNDFDGDGNLVTETLEHSIEDLNDVEDGCKIKNNVK
ncbi:hypothetical protein LSTR_LSTR017170, partial [Laodelphax striatellus]